MRRGLDTKTHSKRIDLHYFKQLSPLRKLRLVVSLTLFAVAALAVVYAVRGGADTAHFYNPGPVTVAHASFQNNCGACHVPNGKGGLTRAVADDACMQCHEGAVHHP